MHEQDHEPRESGEHPQAKVVGPPAPDGSTPEVAGTTWREVDHTGSDADHTVAATSLGIAYDAKRGESAPEVQSLRLSYRDPALTRIALSTALVPVILGSLAGMQYLNEQESTLLNGLLSVGAVLLMLASSVGFALSQFTLPRALMPLAVVIDTEGIEFVQKERFRLRLVRSWLAWSQVQAIVSTSGTTDDSTARVEIYLAPELREWCPRGVGVVFGADLVERSTLTEVVEVVSLPARRLRLLYDARAEWRARNAWGAVLHGKQRPHGILHLRASLLTFAPALCHGFGDLPYDPTDIAHPPG